MTATQIAGLGSWLSSLLDGLVEKILQIFITPIAMILYTLQVGFFWLIDCVQSIFRSMAGLDLYYYQGEEQSGDIVISIITSDTIMTIFWSVLVVAIMLLFVTTFVAIIRVEFTEKGAGNAKGPIIGRAIKSLAYFAIVPVVSIFGIWIANVFLRSFDEATSNQSYALSTTVFFAASHDANRARSDSGFADKIRNNDQLAAALGINSSSTNEEVANAIDTAFLQRSATPGDHNMSLDGNYMWVVRLMEGDSMYIETFDCSNFALTYYFYDLFLGYSYLIGFMGGFVAAVLLLTSCIAIIQRLYELAILFVVSPAVVAFMPLDDGAKYKQWRGEFVKRVGMMYGPVIGLNLLFIILAVLRDVDIFYPDTGLNAVFNSIVQLIFLIVGLIAVKDFSSMISGLVGSADAISQGQAKKDETLKMAGRTASGSFQAARFASQVGKAGYASTRRQIGSRLAGPVTARGREKLQQEIDNDIKAGKYYKTKDGEYKKKGKNGEMEEGGVELDAKERFGASEREKVAQKIMTDDKTAAIQRIDDKYKGNSLGNQLSLITRGEGFKTGIGQSYEGFMQSAGKDFQRYLTRKGVADAAASGEGVLGNLPIWGGNIISPGEDGKRHLGKQTMSSWDAANKKAKEKADAEEATAAQAKANAEAITAEQKATIAAAKEKGEKVDAEVEGGVVRVNGITDVRVVSDLSRGAESPAASGGAGGTGGGAMSPEVLESFRSAVESLTVKSAKFGEKMDEVKFSALKKELSDAAAAARILSNDLHTVDQTFGQIISKISKYVNDMIFTGKPKG